VAYAVTWRYNMLDREPMRLGGYRGRLTAEHFLLMRIPRRFWEAAYDQIEPGTREVIRSYLMQIDTMLDSGTGLLLWGKNGRGKTSAAVVVAKEARRRGASVLMTTAASLVDSIIQKTEVEDGLLIDRARSVDFLLIDDLGKEHDAASGFSTRVFENLIRERSAAKLTTWITTNMGMEELSERYMSSMMEVLKETVLPIKVDGENRRDEAAKKMLRAVGMG
jgi:DNA replication protein DnaC